MVVKYKWWGFGDPQPPENFKTKKQLNAIGKKPGEPVGVIRTPDYDLYLYDPETCPDKKPLTEKQKAAIVKKKAEKEHRKLIAKIKETESDLDRALSRLLDDLEDLDPNSDRRKRKIELGYDVQPFPPEFIERRIHYLRAWIERSKQLLSDLKNLRPLPQPKPYDAVLGGQLSQPRPYDVVLGGTTNQSA